MGSILFWNLNHFVVLESTTKRGVVVVDPAVGRQRVDWEQASRAFSGVALLFEPMLGFERSRKTVGSAARYLRPLFAQRATVGRSVVISVLLRLFALAVPLMVATVVDRIVPYGDKELLFAVGGGLAVIVFFNLAASVIRGLLLLDLRLLVDRETTLGFLDHLVALPYAFHLRRTAGDLTLRLRSNAVIREVLTTGTLSALLDCAFAAVYLALLIVISPRLAALALLLGGLQVAVLLLARGPVRRTTSDTLAATARSQGYAIELLAGISTIKATGIERAAVAEFRDLFEGELSTSQAQTRVSVLVEAVTNSLGIASPLVVLAYSTLQVLDGSLSLGTALAANSLAAGVFGPLATLVSSGTALLGLRSYFERLDDVFDVPVEQHGLAVRPAPVLSGAIHCEGVAFAYSALTPLVVADVTLRVDPGETLALVGRSGSGKTTLAMLLVGLNQPTEGRVCLDGEDLSEIDLTTLRQQVAVVTQDPYLFARSIRDNIAFGRPDLTLEDVERAAEQACILGDIAAFPQGLDTVLSEGGASVSGGQRQRIALARALARGPKILVLDEATSHLDTMTEREVYEQLRSLTCTRIVVAHRLSTVEAADKVAVLDQGRVVEFGRPDALLAQRGPYWSLVRGQMLLDSPTTSPRPVKAARPATKRARVSG
jgi:ABC-type bacteriocin/lantibiotic exporter with double-glycine peptidase domain